MRLIFFMHHAGSKHVLCKEIPKQCESEALGWFAQARQIPRREVSPFIFRAYFGLFVSHFHIKRENIHSGMLACMCVCSADGKRREKCISTPSIHNNSTHTSNSFENKHQLTLSSLLSRVSFSLHFAFNMADEDGNFLRL